MILNTMQNQLKFRTPKHNRFPLVASLLLLLLLGACTDTDKFFDEQIKQPEIILSSLKSVYSVGDTLTITGRLNPENNLSIHIGNADATILSTKDASGFSGSFKLKKEEVKVIISKEMGVGLNKQITVTSAGITVTGPAIEIVGDASYALLGRQLQLQKVADIPSQSMRVYCRSGNGNAYFWNATTNKLSKITAAEGSLTEVFSTASCVDANGLFSILEFNAGGISPDEKYFYFSAKVQETDQSRLIELYKLCRYNLQTKEFSTLNRTEYSLVRSRRTLAATQPCEGKVGEVKIFKITAIQPDAAGNLYVNLMDNFLTRLDVAGNYSYLFDFVLASGNDIFIPQISDVAHNQYYATGQVHQFFPGISTVVSSYLDVEAQVMYANMYPTALLLTDMKSGFKLAKYNSNWLDVNSQQVPYVTASLNSFNGGLMNSPSLTVNGKLVGLYFGTSEYKSDSPYELPALCQVDFDTKNVTRYALKRLVMNGYSVSSLYDMDKEGMLYMTATTSNNQSVLVKTTYLP